MSTPREVTPEVWLHFPTVPSTGREGVLVLLTGGERDRLLLVDGAVDQVESVLRWSSQRKASKASRKLEITWAISHYHDDHVGEGQRLLRGDDDEHAEAHLVAVFCPTGLFSAHPHDCQQAFASLGPKLDRLKRLAMDQTSERPEVILPKLGRNETIWNSAKVRVEAFGGPHRDGWPKGEHARENARSLIIFGYALEWRASQDPPFAFILPGDAEKETWAQMERMFSDQDNLAMNLPIAVIKLAHHGSGTSNPTDVLERLLGSNTSRKAQVAVRVRNAPKAPRNSADLEQALQGLGMRLHDTRDKGDLWLRLRRGEPLIQASSSSDSALDLPACFRS